MTFDKSNLTLLVYFYKLWQVKIILLSLGKTVGREKQSKLSQFHKNFKNQARNLAQVIFMFYQIFLSPKVKRIMIINKKHGIYALPHELPNDLRHFRHFRRWAGLHAHTRKKNLDLRKLGNIKKIWNLHRIIA